MNGLFDSDKLFSLSLSLSLSLWFFLSDMRLNRIFWVSRVDIFAFGRFCIWETSVGIQILMDVWKDGSLGNISLELFNSRVHEVLGEITFCICI